MRLTKQTAYSIRILIHCAQTPDRFVKTSEIARLHQITDHNVAKIVPMLVHAGFVATARGRSGGIRLAKPAEDIRIGDIVRATESTHMEADCYGVDAGECAIRPRAPINQMLDEALDAFIAVLDQHTLHDLVARRPRLSSPSAGEGLPLAGIAQASAARLRAAR
jgi:Rrf2 family protein